MVKKALVGLVVTCVLSALSPAAAIAAPTDVVLYASDATNLHGNWARVSDATAAGGQLLASAEQGWATTSNPLATPADYFDFTFTAVANTPYHVWTRLRATANSKYNDSLFAQFSDAVDPTGAAVFGLGTTSGVTLNLATDAAALSVNGWGWQDGAYWLAQPKTITFATTGTHTLRMQTREDGGQLDQVVLSAALYLTSAPGTATNDTHIVAKPAVSTPFTGTAFAIPGTIEAEAFDNGGEGLAYHDATAVNSGGEYRQTGVDLQAATENGYNVGWITAGEWLNYSVTIASTADYLFEARVASFGPGGAFHVEFGGRDVTGALTIPNTGGWQNWTTVATRVALAAGPQTMRVVFDSGVTADVGNLTWVRFSSLASAPFSGAAIALPGTLHAENFDNGGEGLGFHDVSLGNTGGQYRTTDVDIEPSSLGGFNVGWMDTGEWLTYSVNVTTAGAYTLQFQVASAWSTGQLRARFGATTTTTAAVPNTGGWQIWTTVTATATLAAGQQLMKVAVVAGGFNLAGITLSLTPPPAGTAAPLTYNAVTDSVTRPKPPLPALGPAGSSFIDPSFGSKILRVTDANTRPTRVNMSYRTPSAGHTVGWNTTSTIFYVTSTDGTVVPYALDSSNATASRMAGNGDGGLTLNFINEPEFSATSPNVIYGVTSAIHTVSQYDFATKAYTPVVDLETIVSGLSGYVGGQAVGGTTSDNLMVFFGGPQQDLHHYALWFALNNIATKKLLDTATSTLNGVPTNVALNFNLHSASIDRSGRYVLLYPTGPDQAAPRYASQEYIWDTTTDVFTALTSGGMDGGQDVHPYGHDAPGFGHNINKDCCTASWWDAGQWQLRSLADPLVTSDLIAPVLTPKEVYMVDHTSWNNAQPDALVPVISGTYRVSENINTTPWRAWDDEIIAVETGAPAGIGARVWRFAHSRTSITSDSPTTSTNTFWYTPRPNVSRNGRWVVFTSNWEKTLGSEPAPGIFRQDVFMIQLQ